MLMKVYAAPRDGEQRYSPADVVARSGKPMGCAVPAFRVLYLLSASSDTARHSRHGVWDHGSRVVGCGSADRLNPRTLRRRMDVYRKCDVYEREVRSALHEWRNSSELLPEVREKRYREVPRVWEGMGRL